MGFKLLFFQCLLSSLSCLRVQAVTEDLFQSPPPPIYTTPPFYDYTNIDKVGSQHCISKETCDLRNKEYQGFPENNCYCDPVCVLTNDCCTGYRPQETEVPKISKSVFNCVRLEDAIKYPGYGVTMITECDENWPEGEVKTYCESDLEHNTSLSTIPVSEPQQNLLFRNMYCSMCNFNYDFDFWKMVISCNNITGKCITSFQQPNRVAKYRICPLQSIIDKCDTSLQPADDQNAKFACENGSYSLVYAFSTLYRNKACAVCDGVPEEEIRCEPSADSVFPSLTTPQIDPRKQYSFKMLVDFNSGHLTDNADQITTMDKCKNNEMYDPVFDKCREILCPAPLVANKGKCVGVNTSDTEHGNGTLSRNDSCTFTRLDSGEYEFTNDSRVFVFSSETYYDKEQFKLSGSDVFVCLNINQTCLGCRNKDVMFEFDEFESYLSFVTLVISLISLAITFTIYICFRELLNTPGKILISLIISLFSAQLMFLISPQVDGISSVCMLVSILMHYFFLAAFCWMNIVALDLWMTFSRQFISPGSGSKSMKRFLKLSAYGWVVPFFIVSAAVAVDFVNIDEDSRHLKPGYGNGVCWITSRDALILFFAGPLGVFKLFDIVAFIFTSIHIIRAKRQGAMARQKTSVCSFLINLKLSLVMGLTWTFAFLANIGGFEVLWYLFIIFNCLQGFFIAISFLCTTKVKRLVRNKYEEVSKSKSSTQMTSLNPSNEQK